MKSLVFVIILFVAAPILAQTQDIQAYLPTENVDRKKDGKKGKYRPEKITIRHIVKNDPGGFLHGNPCWIEETRKMGFEYVVQRPGIPGSIKPFKRIWENTKTITILILTKSPFWKTTLQNRVKDCRRKTGDLVG